MIPKPGTRKRRRLGIPTVADRVVQASLKLVLEPIFEADFAAVLVRLPARTGVRTTRWPRHRFLASKTYEWVLEGDITACFDEISHSALMDRVRARIGDKRVLALVKAFLKAGILTEAASSGKPARHPARRHPHAPNAMDNPAHGHPPYQARCHGDWRWRCRRGLGCGAGW